MYKLENDLSPIIMNSIFPKRQLTYDLRKKNNFVSTNIHTTRYGAETVSFRGPKTWALVPDEIKTSKSLDEFKAKIKNWEPIGCECRLCKVYVPNIGFL